MFNFTGISQLIVWTNNSLQDQHLFLSCLQHRKYYRIEQQLYLQYVRRNRCGLRIYPTAFLRNRPIILILLFSSLQHICSHTALMLHHLLTRSMWHTYLVKFNRTAYPRKWKQHDPSKHPELRHIPQEPNLQYALEKTLRELRHFCPSVLLSWRNSFAATGRKFFTLDVSQFFENLSRKFKLI